MKSLSKDLEQDQTKSPEVLIEDADLLPPSEASQSSIPSEESPKNIKKLFKNLIPEGESKSEPTTPKSPISPSSPPFQPPTDAVSPEEVESLFK